MKNSKNAIRKTEYFLDIARIHQISSWNRINPIINYPRGVHEVMDHSIFLLIIKISPSSYNGEGIFIILY